MILPWEMKEYFPIFTEDMEERLRISLVRQFPTLPFARKADRWLSSIKSKSIETQLRERRIIEDHYFPLSSCKGFISLSNDGSGIIVYVDADQGRGEKFFTLGHEIGHTFHFDLRTTPLKNTIPDMNDFEEGDPLYKLVEEFADAFAEKWLAGNGKGKMEEWRKRRNEHG